MLIIETFGAFLLGFTIGLTGALVPGPMLFATIEFSLKRGWLAGPEVFLGHMLVELMLFILILFGFASFISKCGFIYFCYWWICPYSFRTSYGKGCKKCCFCRYFSGNSRFEINFKSNSIRPHNLGF